LASLGNFVWYDLNEDGIQDAGEAGVPDVTVKLFDSNGAVVGTTTTDSSGNYLFSSLQPGIYTVQFDLTSLPAGYVPSPRNAGSDDTVDSDASPSSGYATPVQLLAGDNNLTIDMGIYTPVKVTNTPTVTPTPSATPLPAALSITKAVDVSLVNIGDGVTYTLTISNTGGTALNNVVVTDVLDSRLDFLFGSNPRGTITASGQTVTANLGTLAVGESVKVIIVAEVNATAAVGDSIPNTATADSDETPPTPSNEVVITVIPDQLPNTGIAGQTLLVLAAILTIGAIALTYPRWRKKATR